MNTCHVCKTEYDYTSNYLSKERDEVYCSSMCWLKRAQEVEGTVINAKVVK